MHLTAVTFGSRGDVEPFATLVSLAEAGHRAAAPERGPVGRHGYAEASRAVGR